MKPIKIKQPRHDAGDLQALPWILLLFGFLLYLPILVEFRAYLGSPRRIYELTRTGYGLWFYGSTTFTSLAFVTFLFRKSQTLWGNAGFYFFCTALAYYHGSKGQIVTYILIWMLYNVYIKRKLIGAWTASAMLISTAALIVASFALFLSPGDTSELIASFTGYADYVRNSMLVIDDEHAQRYYGRLLLENEVYSRIPRALMPGKPKDFGPFLLAKIYSPAAYRSDQGAPAFDIGAFYADFGPLSLLLICAYSASAAWFLASLVASLRRYPNPASFIVFLFLAGINIIPLGGPFFLPETIVLAGAVTFASRLRTIRGTISLRRSIA